MGRLGTMLLLLLPVMMLAYTAAQSQQKEPVTIQIQSPDMVRLQFQVRGKALEICKETPWSERACVRFDDLPDREIAILEWWLNRREPAKKE